MATITQLQKQRADMLASIYREGLLDDQYLILQILGDEASNPLFVHDVVNDFFFNSDETLSSLEISGDQQNVDFKELEQFAHRFKGSSSSIGAQKVTSICAALKTYSEAKNLEGCVKCLEQIKDEYCLVKNKVHELFKIEKQIVAAGGSIPVPK